MYSSWSLSKSLPHWQAIFLGLVLLLSVTELGQCTQSDFPCIVTYGLIAFAVYGIALWHGGLSLMQLAIIGLLSRLAMIFLFPTLSDDIYRFVWDGRLTLSGYNPYSYLPSDMVTQGIPSLHPQIYDSMNSPHYYTIYPPVAQAIFWISALWTDVAQSAIVMKIIFVIAECFTLLGLVKLLQHLNLRPTKAVVYWLNPLIIVEGVGNLHFEIIMLCFLIWAAYYLFVTDRIYLAASMMALSIASKLLPLMLLPYILIRCNRDQAIRFFLALGSLLLLIFVPILLGIQVANFASSIDLYFQKFEFNASVYYILRYCGRVLSGYNLIHYIGPALGLITVALIVRKAYRSRTYELYDFLEYGLFSFTAYLLLATTVHPWYLTIPVALSVFSQFRYVIVWSGLIMLTYINYSYDPYQENLTIIAIEYLLVLTFLLWEYRGTTLSSKIA